MYWPSLAYKLCTYYATRVGRTRGGARTLRKRLLVILAQGANARKADLVFFYDLVGLRATESAEAREKGLR